MGIISRLSKFRDYVRNNGIAGTATIIFCISDKAIVDNFETKIN